MKTDKLENGRMSKPKPIYPNMIKLSWAIDEHLQGKFGYAVIIFPLDEHANCELISKGRNHGELLALLKTAAARVEAEIAARRRTGCSTVRLGT